MTDSTILRHTARLLDSSSAKWVLRAVDDLTYTKRPAQIGYQTQLGVATAQLGIATATGTSLRQFSDTQPEKNWITRVFRGIPRDTKNTLFT